MAMKQTRDLRVYADYGCRINALDPEALFRRYQETGFLYPAKLERLAPYLPLILGNLRKALRSEAIFWVVTYEHPESRGWASISTWRSTTHGVHSQHLASLGGPLASRAVMLADQRAMIQWTTIQSAQNWFRPTNKYAARIFGSITDRIGPEHASVSTLQYLAVPRAINVAPQCAFRIVRCREGRASGLHALAQKVRGEVYACSMEYDDDDLELQALDELYRAVGLRRYRNVWLAFAGASESPSAAIVVNRGPIGLSFSFLENRCDLLVSPDVAQGDIAPLVASLMKVASSEYEDSLLPFIPVAADDRSAGVLLAYGAQLIQTYSQSIWRRGGFEGWYTHVDSFYQRIIEAQQWRNRKAGHLGGENTVV